MENVAPLLKLNSLDSKGAKNAREGKRYFPG
jgi:hypothetical protein